MNETTTKWCHNRSILYVLLYEQRAEELAFKFENNIQQTLVLKSLAQWQIFPLKIGHNHRWQCLLAYPVHISNALTVTPSSSGSAMGLFRKTNNINRAEGDGLPNFVSASAHPWFHK